MNRKNNVPIVLLTLFLLFIFGVGCKRIRKKGEFVAGTFILTQKSLSEAPYRYAGVLRKALDNAETKDPPSKSDEEDCSVRYRIRPSGTFYFFLPERCEISLIMIYMKYSFRPKIYITNPR